MVYEMKVFYYDSVRGCESLNRNTLIIREACKRGINLDLTSTCYINRQSGSIEECLLDHATDYHAFIVNGISQSLAQAMSSLLTCLELHSLSDDRVIFLYVRDIPAAYKERDFYFIQLQSGNGYLTYDDGQKIVQALEQIAQKYELPCQSDS